MTDQSTAAEDSLRALARDLVDELSAARALELTGADPDDIVNLAFFQVRPFQRQQRTAKGTVIPESVRGHSSHREGPGLGGTIAGGEHYVQGEPGHVIGNVSTPEWVAGQKEFEARGKAVSKLHEDIQKTRNALTEPKTTSPQHHEVAQHLARAQEALEGRKVGQNKIDQPALSEAYGHLHAAHQAGVEGVLSRATPETKDDARRHLDRIQGHMERLDKVTGTKPDMTRKIVGTVGQQNERAAGVRDAARTSLQDAAEKGDTEGVKALAKEHQGLVEPQHVQAASERAGQVASDRTLEKAGFRLGDAVMVKNGSRDPDVQISHSTGGVVAGADARGRILVKFENQRHPAPEAYYPDELEAHQPEAPRGAAAVYPQVGQHLVKPAGGSISGHENIGRAIPQPAAQAAEAPHEAELTQMKAQVAKFQQREAARAQSDLKEHLGNINAAEAERKGIAAPGEYKPLSDAEFRAHQAEVEEKLEAALRAGRSTDKLYSLDGQGQVWTPARSLQHGEILKDFMDKQVNVPSRKEALFLAGLPGSGKSSLLALHPEVHQGDHAVLNPDIFKEELMRRGMAPQVEGLSPMETAALVHEESGYLADRAAETLMRRGKNIAWDVTMNNHVATTKQVAELKDAGYNVHAIMMDTPSEEAANRAASRYRQGLEAYREGKDELGGRLVPRHVVLRGEAEPGVSQARRTFESLKPHFTGWERWSGKNVRRGEAPRLAEASGPISSRGRGIPSVEELLRQREQDYTGATEQAAGEAERGGAGEQAARAAETGQAAGNDLGLTQANPGGTIQPEESEFR